MGAPLDERAAALLEGPNTHETENCEALANSEVRDALPYDGKADA